jgi:bacteriophage N4 adsorption protein B
MNGHMLADMMLTVAWELALFAGAVGLLLAIDDLAVDALWIGGVGRRPQPISEPHSFTKPLRYAVFVPAWEESGVVATMLRGIAERWPTGRVQVYVGVYPNDLATISAVASVVMRQPWVQMVIVDHPGPTTKGDCLNQLWSQLSEDRIAGRWLPDAVVIHDAEDLVDPHELAAHDDALVYADYSQIPVAPLVHPQGRWISGHYVDEFAEAHLKELAVREAVGAILPTAGVGCAIRVEALDRLANGGEVFAAGSLTEDYELGLRLAASGARGALALYTSPEAKLVATRAYFPWRFDQAVRQKTRWTQGIALDGWDRMGWLKRRSGDAMDDIATAWMLWRDRRTLVSALAMAVGYCALIMVMIARVIFPQATQDFTADPLLRLLAAIMTVVLLWRLLMRAVFTARAQGWRQGMLAVPRLFVSNAVLMACSWRALWTYVAVQRGAPRLWDKTAHDIPEGAAPAGVRAASIRVPSA